LPTPRSPSRSVASCLTVIALGVAACAPAQPEVEQQVEADADWLGAADGTPVYEYRHPPLEDRDGRVELVADLVIGERSGVASYSFGEAPPALAIDERGRIFAYDSGNYRIAVFAADGEFLYQFGSRGAGPGEFGRDSRGAIGFLDGRLFVYFGYRRIGFFTPAGEFIQGSDHRITDARIVPLDDGTVMASGIQRETTTRRARYTVGRFALTPDGMSEQQSYVRVPASARPSFAAERSGKAYVSSIGAHITQVAAFAGDGAVRWVARFRWPPAAMGMPSDLLLDGKGLIYVLPRLNRVEAPAEDTDRQIEVLSPDGALLVTAKIRDLQMNIVWQQARGEFIYGVRADPDTYEWQLVRYRLRLPLDDRASTGR
jgi:hypothetical protein